MSVRYFSPRCAEFLTLFFFCSAYLFGNLLHPILLSFAREVAGPFAVILSFLHLHKYMSRLLINKTNNTVKALTRLPLFLAKLHKYDVSWLLLVQNSSMAIVLININFANMRKRSSGFFDFTYLRIRDCRPLWLMPRLLMNTINNTIRASHPLAPVVPLKVAQVTYASNFTCAAYVSGQFSYSLPACTRETTGFLLSLIYVFSASGRDYL